MDTTKSKINLSQLTRQLLSESDHAQFIRNAIELIAKITGSKRVEFLSISEDKDFLKTIGLLERDKFTQHSNAIRITGSVLEGVIRSGKIEVLNINDDYRICVPLSGLKDDLLGLLLLDKGKSESMTENNLQSLEILSGVIGVTFWNLISTESQIFDPLTGLYTRKQFEIRLQEEMMRVLRYREMLALISLDIDNFGSLNRTYSRQQCDSILSELAYVINMTIRKYVDIACRYEEDQFMVILPKSDLSGADTVARRIVNNCEEFDFKGQDEPQKITVSAGVSFCDNQSMPQYAELVEHAERMMKKAKENGGNGVGI